MYYYFLYRQRKAFRGKLRMKKTRIIFDFIKAITNKKMCLQYCGLKIEMKQNKTRKKVLIIFYLKIIK